MIKIEISGSKPHDKNFICSISKYLDQKSRLKDPNQKIQTERSRSEDPEKYSDQKMKIDRSILKDPDGKIKWKGRDRKIQITRSISKDPYRNSI